MAIGSQTRGPTRNLLQAALNGPAPTFGDGLAKTRLLVSNCAATRLENVATAARRFGRPWTEEVVSTAARECIAFWPVWLGGIVLAGIFAVTLDAGSVSWARALPGPIVGFFRWLTGYGKSGWLLFPTGSLCLILLLANWRHVSRSVAAAWTEVGLLSGFAFTSIAGTGIAVNVVKQFVGRGRPIVFDTDGAFSLIPFQFNYAQASFPSGHATTMGALAVVVAVIVPQLRWPALSICAVVASSRVVVRAHYPSDVVVGFMLGAALTWFYVHALARCGIVFARGPDGTIRARVIAIRHMFLRPGGFSIAAGNLWSALFGAGSRAAVQGAVHQSSQSMRFHLQAVSRRRHRRHCHYRSIGTSTRLPHSVHEPS